MLDRTRFGAYPDGDGVRFSLFSSVTQAAAVRLFDAGGRPVHTEPLEHTESGTFAKLLPGVSAGALYRFVLDGDEVGDPYARFLPFGVEGPARVEAPGKPFGKPLHEAAFPGVIYELHLGTFTEEGTYRAASRRLPYLAELGVNAIELMPLSAFPGRRGWGYDGVAHFAPFAPYGEPDDLRQLIADAHDHGLGVILDVVYNHFGPTGNWLPRFAPEYFSKDKHTPWGLALDFENPRMRRYVLDNARYWLDEFGFDGLRLDATHAIFDDSPEHVLHELSRLAKSLDPPRYLIAEDERNQAHLVTGYGLDALWADDFHHAVRVNLTREQDGYYAAYEPRVGTIAQTINAGWLYEGQVYPPSGRARGSSAAALELRRLVYCVQNHDQIGNRPFGTRLNEDVGEDAYGAASVLLLFLPATALLFMGQEWAAQNPFLYFTDHHEELGRLVSKGRREEFKHFPAFADSTGQSKIPDPQAFATFEQSRLDWSERERSPHRAVLELYRRMLHLRATDSVLAAPCARRDLHAHALGDVLFVQRRSQSDERLLVLNFGAEPRQLPHFEGSRLLVKSGPVVDDTLGRHGVVVLAGRDFSVTRFAAR